MHAGQVNKHRKCSFTVKSITAPGWLLDFWDVGEREGREYIRKVGVVGWGRYILSKLTGYEGRQIKKAVMNKVHTRAAEGYGTQQKEKRKLVATNLIV